MNLEKMKYCKTNKLNIQFNVENIFRDFSIVKFSTSDNYIKYGALILDSLSLSLHTKSIVFERGKSFYGLFESKTIEKIDLKKELEKVENSESFSFKLLNINEIDSMAKHTLTQLLINSIATPNHFKLTFNNLTGKLYLISNNYFKLGKKNENEHIFKIVGLELNISPDLLLQLNVRTFSSILLIKKMNFSKKKFADYPKYTFVHSTGTLKRVLYTDNIKGENQYFLKQTLNSGIIEKNIIPFLNFKNLEDFNKSKIGILNTTLLSIENKLSNYLNIDFNKVTINKTVRYKSSFKVEEFDKNIFLIDLIKDQDSLDQLQKIQKEIKKIVPKSTVKIVNKENINGFNLKLIHKKSYYEKYEKKDPYKLDGNSQHLTLEDFKTDSLAILKVLISESIIKNDLKNNQISIINWNDFEFQEKWIFGTKINDNFNFITIYPNGILKIERFEVDLFNQNEYDILCDIFNDDINIEFIVQDDKGNINIIKRTQAYTIPNYKEIYESLNSESNELILTKESAIKFIQNTFEDAQKKYDIINKINSLENWNKKSLLNCFANRTDKKLFTKIIKEETGEILKSYLRDKTRYDILDSQLDIHLFEENDRQFYYVGIKGEGIQQQITRRSIIREVEPYKNSEIIFGKLLPLMNVDFVKNGDLTVFPFPIKYLKEWSKIHGTFI